MWMKLENGVLAIVADDKAMLGNGKMYWRLG